MIRDPPFWVFKNHAQYFTMGTACFESWGRSGVISSSFEEASYNRDESSSSSECATSIVPCT